MSEDKAPDGANFVDITQLTKEQKLALGKDLISEVIAECKTPEKIELLRDLNNEAELTYQAQNILNRYTLSDKKDPDSPDYKYSKQIGVSNMLYMIDTKATTDQTLEYGKKKFGKSDEWLSVVRNKPFYTQAQIVKIVQQHRDEFFKGLDETTEYHKTMLTQADTPISQLNHLSSLITMSDRIDKMESRLRDVEYSNSELQLIVKLQGYNLEAINDYIGMSNDDKKPIAKSLREEGLTYKQISEKLGVSIRTLKYWNKQVVQ